MNKYQAIGKSTRFAGLATGVTILVAYGIKLAFGEELPPDVRAVMEGAIGFGILWLAEYARQKRKHGWKR